MIDLRVVRLGYYWNHEKGSDKDNIIIIEILKVLN